AAHRNTCELFEIGDDGTERVAVIRVAVQRLGVQHELAALGRGDRGGNRDLAAELVASVGARRGGAGVGGGGGGANRALAGELGGRRSFAFANAFDLRRMQRID